MPARQPTPGPSTLDAQVDTRQHYNTRKRSVSENILEDEQRQSKKHRKETESENKPVSTSSGSKDSKKKRRKKKKKSPLTTPGPNHEQTSLQTKLKDPIPLSLTSSATLSEVSTPPPTTAIELLKEPASIALATPHTRNAEGDGKLAFNPIDKGKAKALSNHPDILTSQSTELTVAPVITDSMKEAQAKIADLTAQLEAQKTLLSRHEDHLSHLQQSLTCQICLDLLYKPYALSPCGHIACYICLVRWFTSVQNDNPNANPVNPNPVTGLDDIPRLLSSQPAVRGTFLRNHKSCPLCRAAIIDRPAEIWSIKSMVAHLIKSKLVELPTMPPPPSAIETPSANGVLTSRNDPWRNIFGKPRLPERRRQYQAQFFPPPPADHEGQEEEGWGPQDMGMYDAEDGGIYRCLDCMHEIWGGVCTNCEREYAGHARFDGDDEEDDFSDNGIGPGFLGRRLREIWGGYAPDHPEFDWLVDTEDDDDEEEEVDHDGGGDIDMYGGQPLGGIDLTDVSDQDSVLEDAEEATFTASTSEDGGDSERSWTSDDEDDDHNALLAHQAEFIDMINNGPPWPQFGQLREDDGVAHIEEIEDPEEEEEGEDAEDVFHSGSDSDPHSHPSSGEEQEEDYEDSFIDDDEEDGANGYNLRRHDLRRQDQVIDLVDSEDDDGGNIHRAIALAERLGGGMRLPLPENSEDSGDDNHDAGHREGHRDGRVTHRQVTHEDLSDEDQEEEEVAIRPAGRRRNPGRNGGTAFRRALFEDDEDE